MTKPVNFICTVPEAKQVYVLGDFNNWNPTAHPMNRQPDGAYGLTTDWWAGHVEKEVGANFGKLLQMYGVHKAIAEARKNGFSVRRQAQANGSIKLVLLGGAL